MRTLRAFWNDESGVTTVEYAVLAGAIAALIGAIFVGNTTIGAAVITAITDAISGTTE
ncbi:MAG: Flp family type IVb pilin [Alphaproteobacteria bacterium]|nr:Flp family type IVb pilin [Alphaproteobacteria bacterium]